MICQETTLSCFTNRKNNNNNKMETSHIVISLLVLSIIALVTYIIFNRKDDEDTKEPDTLEKALEQNQTKDIQIQTMYQSYAEGQSFGPSMPAKNPFDDILNSANASNVQIIVRKDRGEFTPNPREFQDPVNVLFEICGCKKVNIDINTLMATSVRIKDRIEIPFIFIVLNRCQTNPNKIPKADLIVNDIIAFLAFEEIKTKLKYTYDSKTRELTFIGPRTHDFFRYAPNKKTMKLVEVREALKTSWMVMASEIFPLIEKSDYLNRQINVCDIKKKLMN